MDNRDEVKAFLSSRRAKVTPEQAGLALYGRNRRVPGLRRSEVADLAGVSVEYYSQLERGNLMRRASESVLDALGRALQLNEAEREHLLDLARAADASPDVAPVRPRYSGPAGAASVAAILEAETTRGADGLRRERRLDVLAANALARRCMRRCSPTAPGR